MPLISRAVRLNYGPEAHLSQNTKLPANVGEEYPALVSDIDERYNEHSGIRLPDLTVPVTTYTGWNLRDASIGNIDLFIGITGGLVGWTLGLPATDRKSSGDPRLSIAERYSSREEFLRQVEAEARALIDERYMLEEDLERVVQRAGSKDHYFLGNDNGG